MAPIPPWTLYIGAGWTVDTQDRPKVVETKIVEKGQPAPALGHIKGYVDETGHPETGVPNAIVAFANHPEITSLASGPDGHFTTLGLPPGKYDFAVKAEGYKDGTCTATLTEPAPRARLQDGAGRRSCDGHGCSGGGRRRHERHLLARGAPARRQGRGSGPRRRDAQRRRERRDQARRLRRPRVHADVGRERHLPLRGPRPGGLQLTASADAYMNDVETLDVKPRVETPVDVVIMKRPKNPLVAVTQREITIKQQVQFAVDSAVILPESNGLLTEIADVLNRNPRIHKVEIQGHTDSNGDDQHNQVLSEDRANSVRTWLVSHGVTADRLDAKGYGEKKPLVPNVTEGNRQKNRRVQFIILDQDKAAPAPAK